jgi:cytochrome c peroxidase
MTRSESRRPGSARSSTRSPYITSFDKVPRSPFRNPDDSFTAAALEGRKIFARAGCPACHSGPYFTDSPSGVLHDVGTITKTSGFRLGKPLTGLDASDPGKGRSAQAELG